METLENNTFTLGETVSDVGEIVTRVTVVHIRTSPGCHAEAMAIILIWHRGYPIANSGRYLITPCVCTNAPTPTYTTHRTVVEKIS
jgi:hypothetical protein